MGRIKSLMVKRASKKLLTSDQIQFSSSFEKNKKILGNTMPSKPIRNKIAGYLARLIRMQQSPKPQKSICQEVQKTQ